MLNLTEHLCKYVPEAAAPVLSKWITDSGCQFVVSRSRTSKLGDYRSPYDGRPHRITVNHNLNKYSFLITAVHEFAHLLTYNQHKNKVRPHGKEWKQNFRYLMEPFLNGNIFPQEVLRVLKIHMKNPTASSSADINLYRALRNIESDAPPNITVEDIEFNTMFKLGNGRVFLKKEKLRKRYKCIEVASQRVYLFNPIAEVQEI